MLAAMKSKRSVAMLTDQKTNARIPVPFFCRDAMPAPSLAVFAGATTAQWCRCASTRSPARACRIAAEPPLVLPRSANAGGDMAGPDDQGRPGARALDRRAAGPLVVQALAGLS
jgi:lauroyl/myristoyl acyltransferase